MRRWSPRRAGNTHAGEQANPREEAPGVVHSEDGAGNGQIQVQPEVVATTSSQSDAQVLTPETLSEPAQPRKSAPIPVPSPVEVTSKQPSKVPSMLTWLRRYRGLFLVGLALGLVFNAQRVLTEEGDVISSIRWFALAIGVILLAAALFEPSPPKETSSAQTSIARSLLTWLRRYRGLSLGALALGLAFNAQWMLTVNYSITSSIRWYALSIVVMLLAWAGTYKNKSFLVKPADPTLNGLATTLPMRPPADKDAPSASTTPTLATTLPIRTRQPDVLPRASGADASPRVARGHTAVVNVATRQTEADIANIIRPGFPVPDKSTLKARFGRVSAPWATLIASYPVLRGLWPRYVLAFAALGLNLFSAGQLRANYSSVAGGLGWLFSLVLLAVIFLRERPKEVQDADQLQIDVEDATRLVIPRRLELAIFIGIFFMTFALRVYRLDDWSAGMHGDEGEVGLAAISILEGHHVSPFLTGWLGHQNFSFWSVALSMWAFGTSIVGLRIFSSILGTLMLLPFYLLVRMWFGTRAALIATTLLAVMDVSIYFGRLGLNNITTPFFLVIGFYFLFRGLRTTRTLDFVLSGYGFMLTLYFYFGGRLTPILVAAVLGYMFLLMPIVRLPGVYRQIRARTPSLGRLTVLRDAAQEQVRGVLHYVPQLILFVVACVCMASPWIVYSLDHQAEANGRLNDKQIFNSSNQARLAQTYAASHTPLYLGLRMPKPQDTFPVLPVVFEKTPFSIEVAQDGFWPKIIWGQTITTFSVFTHHADASSFYTFTGEPAAKPIEAALLILGVAFALWRWRDSRMACLSIWFWATLLGGGALTIDAPYVPRMVGLVPTLAIFIAIPLNKLCAELVNAVARGRERLKTRDALVLDPQPSSHRQPGRVRLSHALTTGVLVGLLGYLSFQNATDYTRYMDSYPYPTVSGQAYFVRQMNKKVSNEGRPTPRYYGLGMPVIYWGHGTNRFLNHGTPGKDMINPANEVPIVDNEGRDVVFIVWNQNRHYLPVLKTYYPDGEEGKFTYGPAGTKYYLFIYYRVKKEQIDAGRRTMATYTPATGPALHREEVSLGTVAAHPAGLTYPAQASWSGGIVAPAFGRYRFSIDNRGDGNLTIDGTHVLTTSATAPHGEVELVLARGLHDVQLSGTLADRQTQVTAKWLAGGSKFEAIPQQYLWHGAGKGLLGKIFPSSGDLSSDIPSTGPEAPRVLATRVDGFLGFRHSPDALGGGELLAQWTGTLKAPEDGRYQFSVNSNGESAIYLDGKLVVAPHSATGYIDLTKGTHHLEVRYNWSSSTGNFEVFWTPPKGGRSLLGPDVLQAEGGIVDPTTLASEPFPVSLEGDLPPTMISPDAIIGEGLTQPRGIAVDKAGNIYVGDRGNHRIVVFSPDGKVAHSWGKPAPPTQEGQLPPKVQPGQFNDISDLAVLEHGNGVTVYVLDRTPRVQVFKSNGEYIGSYEPEQMNLYGPNGITAGVMEGKAYLAIASTGQNMIARLPPIEQILEGRASLPQDAQSIAGSESNRMEQPLDVLSDGGGNGNGDTAIFYAIDMKNRLVELRPKKGSTNEWEISKQWRLPVGTDDGGSRLAMSPDGSKVYMSDIDRRRVAIIDLQSGAVTYFESGGREGEGGKFSAPSGIAVGPGGRLYVLDREQGNIQVFTMGESSR